MVLGPTRISPVIFGHHPLPYCLVVVAEMVVVTAVGLEVVCIP
jgi:hypothetical protein